jgi:poly [ADP-ribose] polymerase
VKRLVQLIFDLNMMKKQMMQIGYNAKKMPLGQLTQNHIQKGFTILKKLLD